MNPTAPVAQAHADAGPTEQAARQRASRFAGTLRGEVLRLIVKTGDNGLTATEAYAEYVMRHGEPRGGLYSVSPRLSELERQGYVRKGETRDDRVAYVATAAGRAWAEGEAAA